MSATGDGATTYLRTAATFTPPTAAYSWALWFYTATNAAFSPDTFFFALTNSTGTANRYDVNFTWSNASVPVSARHRNADGTYAVASYGGVATNAWHHLGAVFNGTTLKLYLDGVLIDSVAASAPSGVLGDPELTVCAYNDVSGFDDAKIAELAIWSVALTATEMLSVAQGTYADAVQNGSIISYSRLNTGSLTSIGNALTNNGTTVNKTYFEGLSGGVAAGGDGVRAKQVSTFTPSGGVAVGGSGTSSPVIYKITMDGGVAVGGTRMDDFLLLGNGSFVMTEGRGSAQTKR